MTGMQTSEFSFLWHQCIFFLTLIPVRYLRLQHCRVGRCWMLWLFELNIHLQQRWWSEGEPQECCPQEHGPGEDGTAGWCRWPMDSCSSALVQHQQNHDLRPLCSWVPGLITTLSPNAALEAAGKNNLLVIIISFIFLGIMFLARTLLDQLYYFFCLCKPVLCATLNISF